ncbi:MAG: UDP-N-acetylmuramyl peptide synthase [Bifidobacteriaceae bacterium]|jgi:UDP-N-acetylmuramyl tripeptide synthase|nr:UDP-N-acetylmuramyl peptide synthase [Bifidobacteriaceae bacterium]
MSGLGDVPFRRVSLEYLKKNFSARLDEPFVNLVTLTSLATDLDSVSPGSLFIPGPEERDHASLHAAVNSGAYAVLVPEGGERPKTSDIGIPVLSARDIPQKLGTLASYMEGTPSESLAVFVVFGAASGAEKVAAKLATLLHMLGNPVGLVSQEKSYSLNRGLNLNFPLNSVQLQRLESLVLEDGAAALVIAADEGTLDSTALVGTQIDVYSRVGENAMPATVASAIAAGETTPEYGAAFDKQTHRVVAGMFDGELARLGTLMPMTDRSSALSISMALAAGITIESIQQAVKVSEEFF